MNDDLKQGLGAAADAGARAFAHRDAGDIIRPARRRVRRYRVAVGATAGVAGVALVGAAAVGIDRWGQTAAPANPSASPSPSVRFTGEDNRPNLTVTADRLIPEGVPYTRATPDTGHQRALLCPMGPDNPRLTDVTADVSNAYVVTDCQPMWLASGPLLDLGGGLTDWGSVTGSGVADSLTVPWTFTNITTSPIIIDSANVSGALTLNREGAWADDYSVKGLEATATSLWSSDSTESMVVQRVTNEIVLQPGESASGQLEWSLRATAGPAAEQIAAGAQFQYTIFVRIPNADPTVSDELFLEFRDQGVHQAGPNQ